MSRRRSGELQVTQPEVRTVYQQAYCEVYSTSEARRSNNTPGLPDFWVMRIGKGGWWHEVKTPDGAQTPEQAAFEAQCRRAGVVYLKGGRDVALAYLRKIGVLVA